MVATSGILHRTRLRRPPWINEAQVELRPLLDYLLERSLQRP
jgi:hypothetical protein